MIRIVVRLPNHLGDACMASPALELLASCGYEPTLVGRDWARELFAAYPWPMRVLAPGRFERVRMLHQLARTLPPPARGALLLTNSFSSALEARLAGLRPVGYAADARAWLLARSLQLPQREAEVHMVEYYHRLVRWLTGQSAPTPTRIELRLAPAAHQRAQVLLQSGGVRPPYVMLCPVATGRHHGRIKAWSGFARLAEELAREGHTVVACPGPGEREAVAMAAPRALLLGQTDVAAFGALLAQARLVVANDSGAGHLAAAVGATLISVFGVTQIGRTAPLGERVRVIGGGAGWPGYEEVRSAVWAALA